MRHKDANLVAILGIIGNIFLIVIKGIVAGITNSQAMISDVFNSGADIFSSLMTFIGNKIASKEADEDHNLGHGKAEYIFSMLISAVMLVVALNLFISSVNSIFVPYDYQYSNALIIVCIITILIKFFLYLYTHKIAKKHNNLLIEANACDHRNDCFLTLLTLISSIFGKYGITIVDGIVGSLVAIWIFLIGLRLFKQSYDVLMDKGMDEEAKAKILKIVKQYPEIKKTNHFNSTPIGYQYQISLTIFVDGNLSTFESHDIANRLEKDISSLEEVYLSIIHVNPMDVSELTKRKKVKKRKTEER